MRHRTLRLILIATVIIACLGAATLNDSDLQAAIDRGEHMKNQWKALFQIQKRQKLEFGGFATRIVASVLGPRDQIAFDVAERKRRQMPISLEIERQSHPSNKIEVMLEANSGGAFGSAAKYRSSQAHVILSVNGEKIHPESIEAGESRAEIPNEFSNGQGGDFKTFFMFNVQDNIQSLAVTVIGADGNSKTRTLDPSLLR